MRSMKNLLFAVVMLCAAGVFAQDKVAYVSMEKAFLAFYKTVNANIIFEQKKIEFEEKMVLLRKGMDGDIQALKGLEADSKNELLSTEAREEAQRKYRVHAEVFAGKRDEFERSRQAGVRELTRSKSDTEDGLVKELVVFIKKFAADNGYTHVFDVSGLTMNRMPLLLVYPEQQEVTEAFIAVINQGHDDEIKAAKAKLEVMKNKAAAAGSAAK